jgi:hypothetical protein
MKWDKNRLVIDNLTDTYIDIVKERISFTVDDPWHDRIKYASRMVYRLDAIAAGKSIDISTISPTLTKYHLVAYGGVGRQSKKVWVYPTAGKHYTLKELKEIITAGVTENQAVFVGHAADTQIPDELNTVINIAKPTYYAGMCKFDMIFFKYLRNQCKLYSAEVDKVNLQETDQQERWANSKSSEKYIEKFTGYTEGYTYPFLVDTKYVSAVRETDYEIGSSAYSYGVYETVPNPNYKDKPILSAEMKNCQSNLNVAKASLTAYLQAAFPGAELRQNISWDKIK